MSGAGTLRGMLALYGAGLARNLAAGARLALLLPVRAFDYRASPGQFVVLVAFNYAMWVASSAARVGFAGELDPAAAPIYLATVPLVLVTALAIASVYRDPGRILLVATALSASDLVFELAGLALPYVARAPALVSYLYPAFFAWIWVVAMRAVAVCCGMRRPQLFYGAGAATAMLAVAFFAFPKVEPWRVPVPPAPPPALADERLFHLQGELIAQALDAIQPGRAGTPEVYFVGFAPDGSADVFGREMRFVKRLIEERYGAQGRSVVLANGAATLEEFPLATMSNLRRVLARVSERMNGEEDVLFLFVSAHGDDLYRLSAVQPPLALAQLSRTALARTLEDSGIRWRVVVVSACYSGGFIEPLSDDNTLVITAAAADRSSFGCEHGNEFTYFGRAFFRDALPKAASLAEAFEQAKALVARQEAEEKLKPSLPQIWIGAAIAERLKAIEAKER